MTKKIICSLALSIIVLFTYFLYRYYNAPKGYNVVIIVSDALRVDVLSCYGGDVKTPNIDWLAKQGILFERAYSISPWTTPSSVAMFTGVYPGIYRNGVMKIKNNPPKPRYYVPDNDLLLPNYLKGIGYDVMNDAANPFAYKYNIMQGFREVKTHGKLTRQEKKYVEDITGITPKSYFYKRMYGFLNDLLSTSRNQPFFFLKWINDPHSPYDPPEEFKQKIDVDLSRLSKNADFYSDKSFKDDLIREFSNYEKNYLKKLYEKEVESVDERIGFIIRVLKQKDLFNNTFVIFTSDHGEEFGEHGRWGHGKDYYENLLHIPLIICGPGIPKGKKEETVVSHLSLMATLKDLLQVKYQDNSQGKSYSFLLTGNPIEALLYKIINDNSVFFGVGDKLNSIFYDALLENSYKLILKKSNTYALYNLADDSEELNDISRKNPELLNKMLKKVAKIREENKRRKKTLKKISKEKKGDFKVTKETIEHLKALGYIE
jgi:arylsulfatase A-like enzyme